MALALLLLAVAPAAADEWGHYANARFGFALDVPPGLAAQGESPSGAGQDFASPTVTLRVLGEAVDAGGFEAAVGQWRGWQEQQGWNVTFQATTPRAAEFSARQGARVLDARAISLCGGTALARLQIEYGVADMARMGALVDRLAQSLRASGRC